MMELLHHGSSNWSYYLSTSGLVYSVAKPSSGASNSIYGSLSYYTKQREAGKI